jgi:hypothetical protein
MPKIKIGWLDHHLYTHHSQVFLPLILGEIGQGRFEIAAAWESHPDKDKGDWCAENSIPRATSPEEVIEASDVLMVVAPNNPEAHLDLARGALASGKPVYVDKYLAHSIEDAREMILIARENQTPLMTSSSLRFAPEVIDLMDSLDGTCDFVFARGMGKWRMHYGVHTIALALRAYGPYIKRICDTGTEEDRVVVLDDGARRCLIETHLADNQDEASPWEMAIRVGSTLERRGIPYREQIYKNLVTEYLKFFETRESPVSLDEQFATVAVEETAEQSRLAGGAWIDFPRVDVGET